MLSTVAGFYFYLKPIWVAAIEKTDNTIEQIKIQNSDKLYNLLRCHSWQTMLDRWMG